MLLKLRTVGKKETFEKNMLSFYMLLDRITIRLVFECFREFTLKAAAKGIKESEEERRGKREYAYKAGIKHKEILNEWHRKVRAMTAQVNNEKIQVSRKRTDISK